ncbi:MAG: hypothetical protein C4523_10130 [Myxococcales bacterium]|nr:MAG: hypothetical protein C4523_10130 [Myxococcales bacterium]
MRSGGMRRFGLLLVILALLSPPAFAADDAASLALKGLKLLDNWQMERAGEIAEKLADDESPGTLYFLGRYHFERGDYETALDYLNGAGDWKPSARTPDYAPFLRAAFDNVKRMKRTQSEHFEIRFEPGKDELLVEAAIETLEKARAALAEDLGYAPPERIVVEFYPRLEMLSAGSGLSMEALRTSGTIAVCKWNRLMVSSPRVAVYGYAWRDTLNHEYVHLVISRAAGDTIPIWLHEGLAKMHELRWRRPPGGELTPSAESLLARAFKENKLVTLDEMHPSMALLPSQDHAALAYTQVLTMIQWLHGLKGEGGLRALVQAARDEEGDLDRAFLKVYSFNVRGLELNWKQAMQRRHLKELDYDFDDYKILFAGSGEPDPEAEIRKIKTKRGRDYMTLGKLLKDRRHPEAAVAEFKKATATLGPANPLLMNYLADSELELGHYQEAYHGLQAVLAYAPNYLPSHLRAAQALTALNRPADALPHLETAFAINPFDPRVYKLMETCYDKLGLKDKADQARRNLERLGEG